MLINQEKKHKCQDALQRYQNHKPSESFEMTKQNTLERGKHEQQMIILKSSRMIFITHNGMPYCAVKHFLNKQNTCVKIAYYCGMSTLPG